MAWHCARSLSILPRQRAFYRAKLVNILAPFFAVTFPSGFSPIVHPSDRNARSFVSFSEAPPLPLSSSLKESELAKFASISHSWWDDEGPFKPLHAMNPTRLTFIRSTLCRHFRRDPYRSRPFEGLKFLDVGCGGGILSEPLARMGAIVTGIDAVEKNITVARLHAEADPLTSKIEYSCTTAEKLVAKEKEFDVVLALEVIEHVNEPAGFCKSLAALMAPDGAGVISTMNRSMRSYAASIILAERLLHWLPRGTHQWSSFLRPEELVLLLQSSNIAVKEMAGMVYNPLKGGWGLSDDVSVNFIVCASKESTSPLCQSPM